MDLDPRRCVVKEKFQIHLKTNVFVKTKGFDFKVDRFFDNTSFKCCFLSESF